MINTNEIKKRNLKRLLDASGMKAADLAKKIEKTAQYINALLNSEKGLSDKSLPKIAQAIGVQEYEFYVGIIPDNFSSTDHQLSITVSSNNHKDLLNGTSDEYRGIPLYESGKLAAGPNGVQFDPYEEPSSIVVVYRKELQGCSHHNLAALRVGGDSMEPTIVNGSIVVVDLSDKEFYDRKIFAINTPSGGVDTVSVKRIQKWEHGFSIISDNSKYTPYLSPLDWNRLCVGRIVWMWKDVRNA